MKEKEGLGVLVIKVIIIWLISLVKLQELPHFFDKLCFLKLSLLVCLLFQLWNVFSIEPEADLSHIGKELYKSTQVI